MKSFQWNTRTMVTVAVAFLLTASVGVMGVWLLLSGQPGTGMMERGDYTEMMSGMDTSIDHTTMMGGMDTSIDHTTMMGAPANRGIFGGYTGAVGLVMILAFVAMVGSLLYALFREKPEQPQPASCWNCERPVETDWTTCPYCGITLPAE